MVHCVVTDVIWEWDQQTAALASKDNSLATELDAYNRSGEHLKVPYGVVTYSRCFDHYVAMFTRNIVEDMDTHTQSWENFKLFECKQVHTEVALSTCFHVAHTHTGCLPLISRD